MRIFYRYQNKIIKIKNFEKTNFVLQGTTTSALGDFNFFYAKNHKQVLKNIRKLKKILGLESVPVVLTQQVHGKKIVIIKSKPRKEISFYKKSDALITNCPGVILGILTADCVPVFMLDKKKRVIGLVHAGWRGIAQKLPQLVLKKMMKEFNTQPQDILIGLGPYIGKCCYQLDKKIRKQLGLSKSKSNYLDLRKAITKQFRKLMIAPEQIVKVNLCTCHNPDKFYSYRRQKDQAGRMLSYLCLK